MPTSTATMPVGTCRGSREDEERKRGSERDDSRSRSTRLHRVSLHALGLNEIGSRRSYGAVTSAPVMALRGVPFGARMIGAIPLLPTYTATAWSRLERQTAMPPLAT